MRKTRIGIFNGLGQRIHHFALHAIGKVAAVCNIFKPTPAIGDFLVLGQRIGDQRESA